MHKIAFVIGVAAVLAACSKSEEVAPVVQPVEAVQPANAASSPADAASAPSDKQ